MSNQSEEPVRARNEPVDPVDEQAASDLPALSEAPEEPYDPTGLTLAREIAHAVGARGRRRRRRQPIEPSSSSARPDDRDPKRLGEAMDRLVDAKGWSKQVNVHTMLGRWPALVGPVNAAHSTPVGYAEGVLTVRTDATVWASSLRAMAPHLVARLNDELGDGTVVRIQVLGPTAPSWKKGRRSVRDGRGPRDTYG